MSVEVLLSCMNEKDYSIIEKSNLKNVSTLIINQTKEEVNRESDNIKHRMIISNTKGLSNSRNLALKNAKEEICILADDDEYFYDSFSAVIESVYKNRNDADIIVFDIKGKNSNLGNQGRLLKKWELLKVSSVQITFRRESVQNKFFFDPLLGAGTGNGSGEENKFLLECYKRGLKIYYEPIEILALKESESSWFKGYDKEYFYNRGASTRYIYGFLFSVFYGIYFIITKYQLYTNNITLREALFNLIKGIYENKLVIMSKECCDNERKN